MDVANFKLAMVLKLNISKAYDSMKWSFLDKLLTKLGLSSKVHKMIFNYVT